MKNYVGISIDCSASMRPITAAAMADYNDVIASIKEASEKEDIDSIVSMVRCGVDVNQVSYTGFMGAGVKRDYVFSGIHNVKPLTSYVADGRSTPLFDSVGELISIMKAAPDADDPDVSFIITVITDGQENSSSRWGARTLSREIQALQRTDKWTFVFRVPHGYGDSLRHLGIPSGNIKEWETTDQGMRETTVATRSGIDSFYKDLKSGIKYKTNFYETDLTGVSKKTLQAALVDVSAQCRLFDVKQDEQIRPFVETHLGRPMKKGAAFYQLTKKEDEVQDYKVICIRDKKTGSVYSGVSARNVLGLPHHGTVKIRPGNHGAYDIFIQSTSVNRRLIAGTVLLYWENSGVDFLPQSKPTPTTQPVKKVVPTNTPASPEYIRGYKEGFVAGKLKRQPMLTAVVSDYNSRFYAGYKDGRGKKKKLFK